MSNITKTIIGFLVCITAGLCVGVSLFYFTPSLKQFFYAKTSVYEASERTGMEGAMEDATKAAVIHLQWSDLIPENDKQILQKYQSKPPQSAMEFGDQILLNLEASTDAAYRSALQSFNTVGNYNEHYVSISGFIVPIDFTQDKSPSNIFIVPYYGACIHFPPPPPNQMIFARLSGKFEGFDITQAYTVKGVLRQAIFEDQLGSSAYSLSIEIIEPYYGEPDDFRQH